MSTPSRPARGRRDPALLAPDGDAGPQLPVPDDEHNDPDEQSPDSVELFLLDEGDIVTVSFTMPVVLEGHARETYLGSKITTRVRMDEDGPLAAARARAVAIDSVLNSIDEAEEALRSYAEHQAARLAAAGLPQ